MEAYFNKKGHTIAGDKVGYVLGGRTHRHSADRLVGLTQTELNERLEPENTGAMLMHLTDLKATKQGKDNLRNYYVCFPNTESQTRREDVGCAPATACNFPRRHTRGRGTGAPPPCGAHCGVPAAEVTVKRPAWLETYLQEPLVWRAANRWTSVDAGEETKAQGADGVVAERIGLMVWR